jgi:hypothetical protein
MCTHSHTIKCPGMKDKEAQGRHMPHVYSTYSSSAPKRSVHTVKPHQQLQSAASSSSAAAAAAAACHGAHVSCSVSTSTGVVQPATCKHLILRKAPGMNSLHLLHTTPEGGCPPQVTINTSNTCCCNTRSLIIPHMPVFVESDMYKVTCCCSTHQPHAAMRVIKTPGPAVN